MAKHETTRPAPPQRQMPPERNVAMSPSLRSWGEVPRTADGQKLPENAVVRCGWGRLIFGHTFRDIGELVAMLRQETPGKRDIALYLRDPHVALSLAPQDLFLDPSHTYRLWLAEYRNPVQSVHGVTVRRVQSKEDVAAVNAVLGSVHMVPLDPEFVHRERRSRTVVHFVAEDEHSGAILGTVTGVDHHEAFGDPEEGSSLWCLAVDPQANRPRVGEALVRYLAEHFLARGRAFMDLSVMHDNRSAIALYEKLGFRRVPVFCLKNRNAINEPLYANPHSLPEMNPYAMIIVREAMRRGIAVEVVDAQAAYFKLTHGGRSIVCRESLSELTSAVAMSRCDDKQVTRRLMAAAGVTVPAQILASARANGPFLEKHGRVVVKPARGEQGRGVTVDVRRPEELDRAFAAARHYGDDVLVEEMVQGTDLRLVVIGHEVVAAAIRKPPEIVGTGEHSVRDLIEKQSRRRAAATGGESRIPIDEETERVVKSQGFDLDQVLPAGERIVVRRTANLHTGGTIHDVTERVHPHLVEVAVRATRALDIPVAGIDLMVPDVERPEYAFIEANERPGLANHEPQPTAERFVDLLFPHTAAS